MNAKELITNAARFIEERGHCKNNVQDEHGRVCMIGAMHLAGSYGKSACAALHGEELFAYYDASRLIKETRPDFIKWNNAPKRTAKEVTDFMHKVTGTFEKAQVTA